jgi:hypothetical protein
VAPSPAGATTLLVEHLLAREGWRRPRGPIQQ